MGRMLVIFALALGLALLAVFAISALRAASRGGDSAGRALARPGPVQKISYAALIVLMLGVSAGLLEGL